jgi:hypothetical protein
MAGPKFSGGARIGGSIGAGVRPPEKASHLDHRRDLQARRGAPVGRTRPRPRSDRALTLVTAASEYIWLYDRRHGVSVTEIAAREGVSIARVRFGLARAMAQDKALPQLDAVDQLTPGNLASHPPCLIPLFPIGPYTPQSPCPHHEPIRPGSELCCMVCHCSGMDGHPALQLDARTDPIPEPSPGPASELVGQPEPHAQRETRKQRRRRIFAHLTAVTEGLSGD